MLSTWSVAAAALLLFAVGLSAVVLTSGQQDPLPILPAAVIEATPSPHTRTVADAIDIAECTASPRTPGTVNGLLGGQPTVAGILPPPSHEIRGPGWRITPEQVETFLIDLPPVSVDQTVGIAATLRHMTACRFTLMNPFSFPVDWKDGELDPYADYHSAYFAHYSDDYFRRGLQVLPSSADLVNPIALANYWFPVGPVPPTVADARQLPDGRVVVIFDEPIRAGYNRGLFVLVLQDGRWLVDEMGTIELARDTEPPAIPSGTPVPDEPARYLEVSLRDDGGDTWDAPTSGGTYRAGEDVAVTLANLGTVSHRFEIPDLGILVNVPAGHSLSFVLNAPEGSYAYRSFAALPGGTETQQLGGVFEFRPPGQPIPLG